MPSNEYVIKVGEVEVWRLFDRQSAGRFAEVFIGATIHERPLATPSDKEGGE